MVAAGRPSDRTERRPSYAGTCVSSAERGVDSECPGRRNGHILARFWGVDRTFLGNEPSSSQNGIGRVRFVDVCRAQYANDISQSERITSSADSARPLPVSQSLMKTNERARAHANALWGRRLSQSAVMVWRISANCGRHQSFTVNLSMLFWWRLLLCKTRFFPFSRIFRRFWTTSFLDISYVVRPQRFIRHPLRY